MNAESGSGSSLQFGVVYLRDMTTGLWDLVFLFVTIADVKVSGMYIRPEVILNTESLNLECRSPSIRGVDGVNLDAVSWLVNESVYSRTLSQTGSLINDYNGDHIQCAFWTIRGFMTDWSPSVVIKSK